MALPAGVPKSDSVSSMPSFSPAAVKRWAFTAGQSGAVRLSLPCLHLEPHFYTLYVGSRSGDGHILDYLPQFGQVLVIPSDETPTMIAGQESGRGGVRQPADCRLALDLTEPQRWKTHHPFPRSPARA